MDHFYIITNDTKDPDNEVTGYIQKYLEHHGKTCHRQPDHADCILVLGGDGTLLRAAADYADINVPFLGINLGSLGFLAEVDRLGIDKALDCLMADDYEIESRMMLLGVINDHYESEDYRNHSLNEVVILGKVSMQLICFSLYVNGLLLNRYVADGIIVSTPTGSTGYNLSAGGPIVEPKAEMIVITPICPHSLHSRSIILSPDDVVTIEIDTNKYGGEQQVDAVFDGNRRRTLFTGNKISISKSEKTTAIIKLKKTSFLEILHRKMKD